MNNNLFLRQFFRRTVAWCLVIVHFYFSTAGAMDWGGWMSQKKLKEDRDNSGYMQVEELNKKIKKQDKTIDSQRKLETARDRQREKVRSRLETGRLPALESKRITDELQTEIEQTGTL